MIQNIWLIAARNLIRNPRRILGITAFVCVCMFLLTAGNALLEGTQQGIRSAFINSFTGDLAVFPESSADLSLFGDQTPVIGEYADIPGIPEPDSLESLIRSMPGVEGTCLQITSPAFVQSGEKGLGLTLFGVDFPSWRAMMPGVRLDSGEFPGPGKEGILLGHRAYRKLTEQLGRELQPGEPLSVLVTRDEKFEIASVPFAGQLGFEVQNDILDSINLVDLSTMMSLKILKTGGKAKDDDETEAVDLDDMFADAADVVVNPDQGGMSLESVEARLGKKPAVAAGPRTAQFVLIRLKAGLDARDFRRDLDRKLMDGKIQAVSRDWMGAAGSSASFLSWIRILFNLGMVVVLLTGMAIVINTLAIAIIERTQEIGTMRAVGASRRFVFSVFMAENMMTVGISGILGVLLALASAGFASLHPIPLESPALRTLFGAPHISAALSPGLYLLHGAIALAVAFLSSLYPVWSATNIKPARAMGME